MPPFRHGNIWKGNILIGRKGRTMKIGGFLLPVLATLFVEHEVKKSFFGKLLITFELLNKKKWKFIYMFTTKATTDASNKIKCLSCRFLKIWMQTFFIDFLEKLFLLGWRNQYFIDDKMYEIDVNVKLRLVAEV